ncbi:MAG: hypothetical protein ACE5D6_07185 [Candidatus Zixiibacteriota bacterium]
MAKDKLTNKLIDFSAAGVIGGASIGILKTSSIPFKGPISSLIGLSLVKKGTEFFK